MESNHAGAPRQDAGAVQYDLPIWPRLELLVSISTRPSRELCQAAEGAALAYCNRILSIPEHHAAITACVQQAVEPLLGLRLPAGAAMQGAIPPLVLQQQSPPAHGGPGTVLALHAPVPQQQQQVQAPAHAPAAAATESPPVAGPQIQNAGGPPHVEQQQAPPVSQPAESQSSRGARRHAPTAEAGAEEAALQEPVRRTPSHNQSQAATKQQALKREAEAAAAAGSPQDEAAAACRAAKQQIMATGSAPTHSRAAAAPKGEADPEAKGSSLIGRQLEVYWPGDKKWYPGTITDYNAKTRKHKVHYDDGDRDDIVLAKRSCRWLEEPQAVAEEPAATPPAAGNKVGRSTRTAKAAAAAEEVLQQLQQLQASASKQPATASKRSQPRSNAAAAVDGDIDAAPPATSPSRRASSAEEAAAASVAAPGAPVEQEPRQQVASEGGAAAAASVTAVANTTTRKRGPPTKQSAATPAQQSHTAVKASVTTSQPDGRGTAAAAGNAAPAPTGRAKRRDAGTAQEQKQQLNGEAAPPPAAGDAMVQQVCNSAVPRPLVPAAVAGKGATPMVVDAADQQQQEAAEPAAAPEEPAPAQKAAAAVAKKRGKKAASAAPAEAVDKPRGAAAIPVQASSGRSSRRPLSETQLSASATAAGSDAEAAADSRAAKRRKPSQQQQQEGTTLAAASNKGVKSRTSKQPAGSTPPAAAVALSRQGSAATSAAAPQLPPEREAADAKLQKEAADSEYPEGWQPFPDSSTDKADPQAAATEKEKERRDREQELQAVVAAAELPHLAPGQGQLRQDTQGCCYRKDIADVGVYRLGEPTGHHAKLWRKTPQEDGSFMWEQLSTSCHDCQHQHVRWKCPHPQHASTAGKTSYCNRCLHVRFRDTAMSLADLHQACPRCRGMCTCKSCLRQPDHAGRIQLEEYSPEAMAGFGGYVLKFVGPPLKQWLQHQQQEAAAGGYQDLADLPVEQLDAKERVNCDRCGTNLIGLCAHCPVKGCAWDICNTCMHDLRQAKQQTLTAGAAAAEHGAACSAPAADGDDCQRFSWTCCNPKCSSTVAAIKRQYAPRQRKQQQQDMAPSAGPTVELHQQHQHQEPMQNGLTEAPAAAAAAVADAATDPSPAASPVVVYSAAAATSAGAEPGGVDVAASQGAVETENAASPASKRQRKKSQRMLEAEETEQLLSQQPPPVNTAETTITVAAGEGSAKQEPTAAGAAEPTAAAAAAPVDVTTALKASVKSSRCCAAQHSIHGDELWSVDGAAALELKFMLPADLVEADADNNSSSSEVLQELRQIAEHYGDCTISDLQLSDCPFLPPNASTQFSVADNNEHTAAAADIGSSAAAAADIGNSAAAAGATRPLTLADLMSDNWWRVIPDAGLKDVWRRQANGSVYLFTPHATDLQWPPPPPTTTSAGSGDTDPSADVEMQDACSLEPLARVTLARLVFWARWLVRDPIIVRGLKGRIPWDPMTMVRAMKNFNSKEDTVTVMDCADFHKVDGIKAASFFKGYVDGFWRMPGESVAAVARGRAGGRDPAAAGAEAAMLKVKDWPPADEFRKELPRHFMDFIERLPVRHYTDPRLGRGPLNLSTALCSSDNPTDLGPKGYLAYGRWQESTTEGDSVTKMHLDMTDAINVLVDVQPGGDAIARQQATAAAAAGEGGVAAPPPAAAAVEKVVRCGGAGPDKPGYGGAGAVWDIVRQSDVARVSEFLTSNAHSFTHQGFPVAPEPCSAAHKNPILSQHFMLVDSHRQLLREAFMPEHCVEMLHFEQHLDEGVFIPGGCPHQVRNLQSCTKVAVDYVSPEAMSHCLDQRVKLRELDLWCGEPIKVDEAGQRVEPKDRDYAEKLQSQLILLRAALAAVGLTAEPQRPTGNLEPELPEVATDARVTRHAAGGNTRRKSQQQGGTGRMKADSASDTAAEGGGQKEEQKKEEAGFCGGEQDGTEPRGRGRQGQRGGSVVRGMGRGGGRRGGAKRGKRARAGD